MKKIVISAISALLFLLLCVTAFAATPDCNDALYSLGLITGYGTSSSDFATGDSLTRAQSVVLLLRYLGVADDALSSTEKAPFDDVPEWASAYVGYAYSHGLTQGKKSPAGKLYFDPDAPISDYEFLTLILRAMEYSDKDGDFVWNSPYALSDKLGITKGAKDNFNRGDAFKICWLALGASKKDGKAMSEKLISMEKFTETQYNFAKRISNGEKITVVCVGDSVTQGTGATNPVKYSYPAQLQTLLGNGFNVVNCGKASSYAMSPDVSFNAKKSTPNLFYPNTSEYKKAISSNPDIVIIMLGTNDARSMNVAAAPEQFKKDYKALVSDFEKLATRPQIVLSTMIPACNAAPTYEGTVHILPDLIKEIGKELNLTVLNTSEDLHDYYMAVLPLNDKVHPTNDTYGGLATYFYNSIFGGKKALPEVPQSKSGVVFVSSSGSDKNDGASDKSPVKTLPYAFGMLRENGGTVVICGSVENTQIFLPASKGKITVTSLYDGVDYSKTKGAKYVVKGSHFFYSDVAFENITVQQSANGQGFWANYNNFTIGDGVVCVVDKSVTSPISINAGNSPQGELATSAYDCNKDCTITVNSGTWSIVRGGNKRSSGKYPVGRVAENVKLSIIVNGGEFKYNGTNSGTGMGVLDGEVYIEVNGGTFSGNLYAVGSVGTNSTGIKENPKGRATLKITGGSFNGTIGAYESQSTAKLPGGVALILTDATAYLKDKAKGFDKLEISK